MKKDTYSTGFLQVPVSTILGILPWVWGFPTNRILLKWGGGGRVFGIKTFVSSFLISWNSIFVTLGSTVYLSQAFGELTNYNQRWNAIQSEKEKNTLKVARNISWESNILGETLTTIDVLTFEKGSLFPKFEKIISNQPFTTQATKLGSLNIYEAHLGPENVVLFDGDVKAADQEFFRLASFLNPSYLHLPADSVALKQNFCVGTEEKLSHSKGIVLWNENKRRNFELMKKDDTFEVKLKFSFSSDPTTKLTKESDLYYLPPQKVRLLQI